MAHSGNSNKFNSEARRINVYLQSALSGGKAISVADIKQVIKEQTFLQAVGNARSSLGITKNYPVSASEDEIDHWILCQIVGGKNNLKKLKPIKHSQFQQFIDSIIFQAIQEANLQAGWFTYMEAYVALGKEPKNIKPVHRQAIHVESVSEDNNSVLVRMDKGLSTEEYRKAWAGLKKFLQKPNKSPITADVVKNKIYLDRLNGMTYGQLAMKYFPEEYEKDRSNKTDYTRDKIKKIVARFKV